MHLSLTIWQNAAYEFWYHGMVFDMLFLNSTEVDARRPGKFGGAWSRVNGTPRLKIRNHE